MYTDRPATGETVDTGVDTANGLAASGPASSAPAPSADISATDTSGSAASAGSAGSAGLSGGAGIHTATTAARQPSSRTDGPGRRSYLDPRSTTERLRLLWSTGARDVTLVAPRDTPRPQAIDPRGWIA